MIRVFFAHPKSMPDGEIDNAVRTLRENASFDCEITPGRDDFKKHFKRCGSWNAWIENVALGETYPAREPRYHAIVVIPRIVGRATAEMVERALPRKHCWLFEGGKFLRIKSVLRIAEDFKAGWEVQT